MGAADSRPTRFPNSQSNEPRLFTGMLGWL